MYVWAISRSVYDKDARRDMACTATNTKKCILAVQSKMQFCAENPAIAHGTVVIGCTFCISILYENGQKVSRIFQSFLTEAINFCIDTIDVGDLSNLISSNRLKHNYVTCLKNLSCEMFNHIICHLETV